MGRFVKRVAALALSGAMVLSAGACAVRAALPDTFSVMPGQGLSVASMPWLSVQKERRKTTQAGSNQRDSSQNVTLAVFGIFPVKTVRAVESERRYVNVCGTPFGIKMFANGALVVGFSDLFTMLGSENPAKEAGLRLGDLIVSAGGKAVRTNEELANAMSEAAGSAIEIVYLRGETRKTCMLTPVADMAGKVWRAGVWVRDSSAGIGTLTFTDPKTGAFAGLGHAISDTDTGAELPLLSGEIVPVTITGSVAGTAGSPGELRGELSSSETLGTVLSNDVTGVYGRLSGTAVGTSCPVANPQEIEPGEAEILATVSGSTAKAYSVRIERVSMTAADPNRNMMIRVTDPELLAATGGIVQGMSGSPILQNGRFVGAVTHVLVNDPTRGYAIFAKTMLEQADGVAQSAAA